jgi:predicted DNA-binding transcriptional regulator YafY
MSNLERVAFMNHMIKTKGFVTRKEVAEKFEVHIDTVMRDIEYMRNYLSVPIKYKKGKGGYVYETPFDMLFDSFNDAVFYYIFVKRFSDSFKLNGIHYVPIISKEILSKISSYIPAEFDELLDMITYDSSDTDTLELTDFRNILDSFIMKRCLEISYIDAKGDETERVVEPLRLINYFGKWYLLAFCHKRNEFRVFLVSRFVKSRILEEKCGKIFTKSEINSFVESCFGMFKSYSSEMATIRVYEPAYYHVVKQKWHKDQITKDIVVDGKKCLEITLPVGEHHSEIIARVMAHSPDCEIIGPKGLRDEWISTIRKLNERFCK